MSSVTPVPSGQPSNRRRGVAVLIGVASFLASQLLLDVALSSRAGWFLRAGLPFVGFLFPTGLYMAVTNRGADDFRSGRTPVKTVRWLFRAMIFGAVCGLAAIVWIARRRG